MIPATREQAVDRLQAALGGAGPALSRCLRLKNDTAVFEARLDGEPVIVKQFFANGAARVGAMQAELEHVCALMAGTPHAINRVLLARPDCGAIVLEHGGDRRLCDEITASGPDRARIIAQAGDWLATYVGPRRRTELFRPRPWLDRVAQAGLPELYPDEARLLTRAERRLRQIGRSLAGKDFTRAAIHGDFVSINALWRSGQIFGVDVQGEAWLPLALDIARFLVWQEITDPAPGPRHLGLANVDVSAFLSAPLLSPDEAGSFLPFFVGQSLLLRAADFRDNAPVRDRAFAALRLWLQDGA